MIYFRPNVKDPGGAALLDIRNQAIIIEYLLKNVNIFFDKNLASAAIAFYPETDDTTTPTSENGKYVVFVFCLFLLISYLHSHS